MKRTLLISLLALFILSASLPPALPSSFYGNVTGGTEGQTINAWVGGHIITHTHVILWQGQTVYSMDIATDGLAEGSAVTFKSGGRVWGYGVLHIGTNQRVDLGLAVKKGR